MKTTETVTHTSKWERVVAVHCDRCGGKMPVPNDGSGDRREFILRLATGYVGYGDYNMNGWQVEDLCDDCAKVLRGLLEANGFKITDYEVG